MTNRPIEPKSESGRVANLTALQIMSWARGKPEPIRNLAAALCSQLRMLARCPHSAAVRAIVTDSTERLRQAAH